MVKPQISARVPYFFAHKDLTISIGGVKADVSITSNGFDGTVDLSELGEGTDIVVSGEVSDAAGNSAATFTKANFVIKDTVAPSIDSVTISTDDVINSSDTLSAVLISVGTTGVEDGQVVSLDVDGVTADVSITSNGFDGTLDLSVLGDSTEIVVSGNVSDVSGNAAATFTKDSFVSKDTVAPSIDSVIISADDVINSSDTLSAVAVSVVTTGVEDGQKVSLNIGGVTADVVITSNAFDGTVDLSGLDDSVEIVVSGNVSDVAGNAALQFADSIVVDTIAPSQVVTLGSIKLSTDTGSSNTDFITNTAEQTISAELNASLSSGDVLYASVDDGANWVKIYTDANLSDSTSFSWTTSLPAEGNSSIQFQVADSADNNGSLTEQNYTLDQTAPSQAVTLSSIKLSTDTGSSNTDFITNTAEQTISAELNASLSSGDVLYASVDDGANWVKIYTDANLSDSTSFSWTTSLPAEGNSSIQFQVADSADNNGSLTEQNYTLDITAPALAVKLDSLSFDTDTGTADDDFITNTAEQTISAELNASLSSGDVLYASVDDGANWAKIYTDENLSDNTSFSWTTSLREGSSSIKFQVADSADNNGSLTEQNYTLDITAPALAVKLDSLSFDTDTGTADDDFITNTAEQTISAELNASLSPGDVLYASVDDGANWAKIYTDENLSDNTIFSWTTSLPAEGSSSIQFQVADSADNNGSLTEQNYTLDQTEPSQAVTLSSIKLSTDTGSNNTDFITNTAEQTISAELNASLSSGDVLYASIDDGASWAKIYTDSNLSGSISFSWTTSLPAEGNSSIQFQVADSADNNGSLTEQNYTLDQTEPSQAVTLSSIKLSTDTGSSNTDFITNTAEQTISAELNASLSSGDVLYASIDDGASWAKIYTDSNLSGSISFSWTTSLPAEGNSSIQFQVADSADNNGSLTEQNYTLDQTAPSQAVTLSSIKLSTDTGSSNTDFITNTAEQTISAELNASLSSGDVLYASVDDGANWAKIYTDSNLSGNTSFSWTTSLPAEGNSSIQFQVADSADNNGSLTEQNYTLDITAPSLAVKLDSLSFDNDTGTADDDFITNTAAQTISAELNASLGSGDVLYASVDDGANWAKIYTDSNLSGSTSFSWTTSLPAEGNSSIQFQVADSADNNGSLTEQNYTLDQTAPSQAITLSSIKLSNDTGSSNTDFITNTAEQTISAELNASLGSGDVLYASVDDGANWAKIYTDSNLSGSISFSWTTSLPAEGNSSIQFQVADSADNNGSLTEQNYTLDQTEPSQAVTLSSIKLSTDTGSSNTDFITNTAEQTISAELNASLSSGDVLYASIDDGANWAKIYTDSNLSGNTSFSWTTSLPAEGNSSIQFQVADSADNNGSLTEQNYTLDITAPSLAVKLDSLSFDNDTGTADDDFITNTAAQTISAELNASLGSGDVLYASVDDGANWAKIYTDSNLSGNTSFSWTTSLPAEGNSSIQFQVADSADNNGSLTEQNYTLDITAPSLAVKLDSLSFDNDTGTADDDFITNTAAQTISAELNASLGSGDVLYASVDDGANWAKIYTDSNLSGNTSFSWTTSLPAEGNSSIQFQVADSADNNGSLTEQNYTLDITAPSLAVKLDSLSFDTDTGTADDDFITNTAEQTISAELNASLGIGDVLYASVDDGANWAKIYTDSNLSGNTSFSWTTSLPAEGNSSIQFQVADSADNNGSLTEQNYTLDITAPSLAVKLDSLSFDNDTGTADDDFITNTAAQTISAELNASLGSGDVLYASVDDGANWAKIYTDSNLSGNTSFSWTTSLPAEGNSSIQFQVADSADNNGSLTEQNYTLDITAPSLAVKLDSLSFDNDTGTADDDFITNTAAQTISAELNASLGSGDVLYASVDDGANWAKIYTDSNLSGNTSFSWTTSLPAEGNSSIQFQVADSADNNGSLTEQNYTLDITAPSLAVKLDSLSFDNDTGTADDDFITNTAAQTISAELNASLGSGDVLYASVDDGANWAKIYTDSNLSGNTSFSWTTSLPAEGNSSIQFQVADSADNNGSLTEQNYTLDQTAPSQAVTLSSIKLSTDTGSSNTDFITNTAEQTISAELNASLSSGDVLYASIDDGASWAKIYTDSNLSGSISFSWTTSLPAEGNSSIQFQVADSADNNGSLTEQNYTLDQTEPSQAVTLSSIKLSTDTGSSNTDFITNTAEQTISAELNASLSSGDVLYASIDDGASWAKIYTDSNLSGSISFSWTTSLPAEGNSSIQFQVADSADNNGSLTEQNYTLDQTEPSQAVTLSSIKLSTDTGSNNTDFITNTAEQTISAELNASLSSGDVLYASIDDGANWAKIYTDSNLSDSTSFSWTTSLPTEGNSSIQFQVADSADNNGSLTEQNYTLDITAPSLAVKLDSLSFDNDTGTADDDFITNTAEQTISAELNAILGTGDVLYASVDDGASWAKIYTDSNLSGNTSFSWTTSLPAEGNSSIQFQVADSADNNGSLTEQNYTLDQTAPSQAVTLSSIKLSTDTGSSNTDFITNTAEQTISAELNAILGSGDVLYASVDDGANWAKIYTDSNLSGNTSFSWTTSLPAEGNSSIQFQVADSADNNGSLTEQNYTLDITAPSLAVKLDSLSFDNDTGTADDDFITNTAAQTISAELNASLGSGDVLYASVDDGANWAKIYTDSNLSGNTSFSWTTSLPAEGNSSIQFQVADSADNNGSLTEQNYTLDITAPSLAVKLDSLSFDTDTGTADDDFITNTAEQTISAELNASLGIGDVLYASVDDGANWAKIYTDSNLSGSISFSWTTSLPAEGNSSIQFQVADSADNNGSLTEQNYTLDITAPSLAVKLDSLSFDNDTGTADDDFITNTAAQTISAELNASLGSGDVLYASVDDGANWAKIYTDSNLSGNTSFSWTTSLPAEGNSSIQFQVADSADNNGSLTEQNYTLDITAPSLAVKLDSLSFDNDTGTADDDFITNTAAQTISAELNASLGSGDVLYASVDDGANWAKIYTDSNLSGNTSFSWTTSLPAEGNSSIQFQVADSADNNGSLTEQNYTLDITAPSLAVKLDSLSFDNDTGTADDDFITNTAAQTISAELNASLGSGDVLYASVDDGANWAKIYTDSNLSGNTSFSWTTSLPAEGNSSIQFQVADSADNNGSLTEQNYTLDITAPSLAVKLDSLSFDTDTGTADDDFITNTAEQTISAELNASLGIGDVLYASVDDGANWAKIYTDSNLSGNTSFSWTTSLPAEGNSSIQFQVADSADNNGSLTEQNYTLDITAPSLAVKLDSLSFDNDTGTADDDFITNTAAQTISAELNASLGSGDVLYASVDDGANWAKIYTDSNLSGNTSFSWTTSLPAEGNSSIQFQVADSADNNGSLTEQNYTLDITAPSLAVKLDSLSFDNDTGTADDDFITNTAAQTISAELNASLGSGDVLYASVDDGANWAKIYTDSNLSGNTSFSWTTSLPAEGNSSIQFQVADSADNNGSLTEQNYTLDITAPSLAVKLDSLSFDNDTGTADDDFITNTAAQTISAELNASLGSGDVLYASVDDGANWAKIYTDSNLSGNTSFSWTTSLPAEGNSSIQFQVADSADNNGSLTEQNYTLDQTAPSQAVTLSSIKLSTDTGSSNTDFITNTAEQTISAELNASLSSGDVLYASIDDGASWAKIYTDSNLSGSISFSWTTSLPAEGNSSIQFQVADSADNNGSLTEQNYTLDQTEPSQAVTLSSIKLSTDTGSSNTDFITNTAEQTISAELNASLSPGDVLYASVDDGSSWSKIYTDSNLSNETSFSWTTSLPTESTSSIQFQVADSADNNGSLTEQNYTLDQTAPSQAVTLSSIKLSTDTGSSNTDFITNTAEQSISAELNASLSSGDVLYASVDDGSSWSKIYTDSNLSNETSFSWTTSLPTESTSSIQFQVADSADNNGSLTEQNYTLDQTAPSQAVTLSSIKLSTDTGSSNTDFITNTAEQSISAELNASLSSGDVLYASVDDGSSWSKIYTDSNLSNETSFSWTTSLPTESTSSIQFQVADSADNNGSLTEQNYTLDQTAPSQAVTLSSIKLSTDTGSSNTDFITNTAEQSISAELNASLSSGDVLYASVDDGSSWSKIYTDSNLSNETSFSWTTSLPTESTSYIQFQVADSADNNGSLTEQNYTLDQTAPSQAVTLSSIKLSTDTGSSNTDFITNTAEQTISAELNAILGTGDVLYASVDGGANWQQVDSANINGTSISWATTLAEGTNTIQFQVADAADNRGDITQQSYTLDTTAPTQSVSSIAFSVDSGTAGDLVTNTASQTITATLSAELETGDLLFGAVSLNQDSTPAWINITDRVTDLAISWDTTLSAGANDIQFIVEDAAGNSGEPAKQSYFFDNEAPKTNTAGTTASTAEASVANLDASNSTDNYGIASYEWTQVQSDGSALSDDDIELSIANANDATTTVNTPGITDDDIDSLSFYFALKITDVAGNSSGATATLNVSNTYTIPDITASTGAPNFDQLSLSWPTETGLTYDLHRSSAADCDLSATNNCADYQLYAALDLSDGAQTDSGLEFFSSYYYWLEAKNDDTVVSLSSTPSEANTTGPALNDTGITGGGDYPSGFDSLGDGTACNGGYLVDDNGDVISDPDNHSGNSTFVPFAAEDCELGRDADDTLNDDSDGKAGFSFTRLNSDGSEYSGDGVYSEQPWACVVDNVTGLIWEVKTTTTGNASYYDQGYTWEGASTTLAAYLNGDNFNNTDGSGLCGRTDWRLPTVQEIHGLTDYAATSAPFIDTGYFPHTLNYFYWTVDDNADPALSEDVWAYNPSNAEIVTRYTNNSSYARLVSSSEAVESHFSDYSDNRYTDHGDGTISDTKTGLMWMKCTYGQNYDSAASSICGATTAAIDGDWRDGFTNAALANDASSFGYTDWRLPNIKELGSLVDFSKYEPAAINTDIFAIPSNDTNLYYWSSTPTNNKDDQELLTQAVVIGFGQGGRYAGSHRQTSLTGYLRLVRDDANTPRILTLDINGNNVINSEDELANISVSGSTIDVEDGQQITLNIGSISTEIEVSNNGFSASVNLSTLADGIDIAVTADASDSAGRAADQFTSTLLKDTVAPSISGVLVSGDDTINSSEANAATITGTTEGVEDGQTISIAINDNADPVVKITATATVTSNAFNITNLNLSGLADGTSLSLTADVSDAAGNPATTHSFDGITKDTIAPTITIDSVATDGIINASEQSSVVINGTASENGQTVLLAISDGTNTVEADTTVSNNSYSATVDLTSFAESSSISLGVTVSDAAGNEGSASKTDIVKDTLKPGIVGISVTDDNVVNSSEILSPVAVSGSTSDVEDNQVITLTINGVTTTTAVNDSSFATTADLSTIGDGTYPVTANVADAAGNPADQATSNFEIDTTPPAQAVTLDSIQLSTDSGSSASDLITNQATQTIGATLSAILGTGDALYASVDGGTTWQQVDSANINGTGISWSATLLNGSSSIQFQVADSADNNGTIVTKDYTLDTTPPEQTISDIDISDDSGALNDDFLTNNPTQTITATLRGPLESGDTLHGSVDSGSKWEDITASVSGTAITWNSVTLSSGSIQLKVVDAAGNDGDVAELAYILDTTAPTIDTTGTDSTVDEGSSATLNASGSDSSGIASYAWAQVQSSSNDASEVVSTDDNYVSLNVANDGTATFTAPGIVDEDDMAYLSLYFKITLTDNAGNPATSSPLTIIVDNSYTTPTISASAVGAPDFNQISLSWSADNSLTYSLYRSTDPDCNIINYNSCTNPALYINSTGITINDTSIASVTDTDSSDSFQLFNSYYYWLGGQIGDEVVFLNSTPTIQATNSGPALNDTGITSGGDYPSGFDDNNDGVAGDGNGAVCNGGYLDAANNNAFVAFVDEDCELGRDATNNDPDDGSAGFSFTRLNSDGSEYSGNGVYNEEPWACVVDNVTGLIWEVKTTTQGNASYNDQGYTWEGANTTLSDYLNGNNFNNTGGSGLCGRSNWRLPSVQEIHGLTDYNTTYATLSTDFSPLIDTSYFSNTRSGLRYWAADVYDDASVWAYNPINGEVATRTASDRFTYARLVSSSEAVKSYFSDYSNSRYTDHGDGTVTDTKTGLMWMKCTYGQSYDSVTNSCSETGAAAGDWQAAFANAALANDASSLSYTDWRLPNIKELGSLVDFGKNAGIDTDTFPIFNNEATYYWSSTPTIVDNTPAAAFDQAVTIGFGTAQGGRYVGVEREITNGFAVHLRLVRDPN